MIVCIDANTLIQGRVPLHRYFLMTKGRTLYHEKWQAPEIHLDDGRILVLEST